MASFRICVSENCKARLPIIKYDGHSHCSNCVGHICDYDNKCPECEEWPKEVFDDYIKHRKKLEVVRERKARNRLRNKESKHVPNTVGSTSDFEILQN